MSKTAITRTILIVVNIIYVQLALCLRIAVEMDLNGTQNCHCALGLKTLSVEMVEGNGIKSLESMEVYHFMFEYYVFIFILLSFNLFSIKVTLFSTPPPKRSKPKKRTTYAPYKPDVETFFQCPWYWIFFFLKYFNLF